MNNNKIVFSNLVPLSIEVFLGNVHRTLYILYITVRDAAIDVVYKEQ
jgi:hypothetical protein